MELFNSLVVSVSGTHLTLINWLLAVVLAIYFIYSGLILGSMILSMFYNMRFNNSQDRAYQRLARDYANLFTSTSTLWLGGGLLPILGAILIYAQLQHGVETHSVSYMLVAFIMYSIGIASIYVYKNSYNFSALYNEANLKIDTTEFKEEGSMANSIRQAAGFWAFIFLLAGTWIFNTGIAIGNNSEMLMNNSFFNLFSFDNILRNLHFITAGLAMTGASFIYMKFHWDGGTHFGDIKYSNFAKKQNLGIALIFLIFQPLFIGLNSFRIQDASNSMFTWIITIISIIIIFYVAHLFSLMNKNNSNQYIKYAFFLLIFSFSITTLNDSLGFQTTNKTNTEILAHNYEVKKSEKFESQSIEIVEETGLSVFNKSCIGCHKFDTKLVGPAYNDVVPQYKDNISGLIDFITNPTRKNPDEFIAMPPVFGITDKQIKLVAEYILETSLANTGDSSSESETNTEDENTNENLEETTSEETPETSETD